MRLALVAVLALAAGSCATERESTAVRELRAAETAGALPPAETLWPETAPPAPGPQADAPVSLGERPTLADYLAYAAQNNPGLQAAFERWRAATDRIPQARALPDPMVGYMIEETPSRGRLESQSFEVSQTLPLFGKLPARADLAAEDARAAGRRLEAQKLRLAFEVKDAYLECYYTERAIAVMRQQRDLMRQLEEVARTRYQSGAAPHADVIRAQVELTRMDDRVRSMEDMRHAVHARLNAVLGRPAESQVFTPDAVLTPRLAMTDAEVLGRARAANPELLALEREAARERRSIDLAGKDYYPDLTLGLAYVNMRPGGSSEMESGDDSIQATVSVNAPIWVQKYRAGVREAKARHRGAVQALAEERNSLEARAKMALYQFRDAERKIALYRDSLLPKARQALEATSAAFRGGKASFGETVDSHRDLLEYEVSAERAVADLGQRLAEIEMLAGGDLAAPSVGRADAAAPDRKAGAQ
jgi:outer membrane protein TolC